MRRPPVEKEMDHSLGFRRKVRRTNPERIAGRLRFRPTLQCPIGYRGILSKREFVEQWNQAEHPQSHP